MPPGMISEKRPDDDSESQLQERRRAIGLPTARNRPRAARSSSQASTRISVAINPPRLDPDRPRGEDRPSRPTISVTTPSPVCPQSESQRPAPSQGARRELEWLPRETERGERIPRRRNIIRPSATAAPAIRAAPRTIGSRCGRFSTWRNSARPRPRYRLVESATPRNDPSAVPGRGCIQRAGCPPMFATLGKGTYKNHTNHANSSTARRTSNPASLREGFTTEHTESTERRREKLPISANLIFNSCHLFSVDHLKLPLPSSSL